MSGISELVPLVGKALAIRPDGSVWRIAQRGRTGRWRSIQPTRADELRPDGYRRVRVQIDGRSVSMPAHRLIWEALVGPIPAGLELNHCNGRRGDNRLENLEVVSKSENLTHSYRVLGRHRAAGEQNGRAVLTASQVALIRQRVAAGDAHRAIAADFCVTHRVIGRIARGEAWRDEYSEVN